MEGTAEQTRGNDGGGREERRPLLTWGWAHASPHLAWRWCDEFWVNVPYVSKAIVFHVASADASPNCKQNTYSVFSSPPSFSHGTWWRKKRACTRWSTNHVSSVAWRKLWIHRLFRSLFQQRWPIDWDEESSVRGRDKGSCSFLSLLFFNAVSILLSALMWTVCLLESFVLYDTWSSRFRHAHINWRIYANLTHCGLIDRLYNHSFLIYIFSYFQEFKWISHRTVERAIAIFFLILICFIFNSVFMLLHPIYQENICGNYNSLFISINFFIFANKLIITAKVP